MNSKYKWKYALLAGLISGLTGLSGLSAQDADDVLVEEDVVMLEEVGADDVPIEQNILATSRPISSVYGSDRSILDTPRNVNIISREQLDAISIKDVRDFSKLTSSSYTKTNFGAPTTPNLRGQEADLMINGIRRGHSVNGNGVPVNFNSVESVNIVKGPAGAVFGTSNYVGGYVDLITKRAFFSEGGSVEYTYGSFDQHTLDLDYNIPISETMAFRTSIQLKEWEGFWDRWYDKSQTVYGTFAWRPNDKYRLDVMGEYYKGNYTENWGVNRVTQDLFDKGLYIPNRGTDADYANFYASNPPVGFGNSVPVDVQNPVNVDRKWKLAAPGDDSNATVLWLQAIQEFLISDTLKATNNTYFHYKDRQTFSSYHYSELMKDNWSIENRLLFNQDFEVNGMEGINLSYGLRLKYQEMETYNSFFQEPANYFDLTRDPELIRVPNSSFFGSGTTALIVKGQKPRGVLNYWYVDGTRNDSESFIYSPFIQSDFKLTDRLSVLLGGTIDYLEHKQGLPKNLVEVDNNGTVEDTSDDTFTRLDYSKNSSSANFYNVNGSIVFKPTEDSSIYFTYNEGEHFNSDTGGAISENALGGLKTELFEIGANMSILDDKGYLGIALFRQEYTTQNQDNSVDTVETDGLEIEFNYQPNRNFFATIGYSYLDSKRTAGFFATAQTAADVAPGGDYRTPTFPTIPGKFETPGVPSHLINALVQYKFDNGIGLQANGVYTAPMNAGYKGTDYTYPGFLGGDTVTVNSARLGSQVEFDAKIFYDYKNWRFELSVFNITDEENWDLPNTGYANGSAVARAERSYEVSVKYAW